MVNRRRRMHSAVTDPRVCLKGGPHNAEVDQVLKVLSPES